MRTWSPSLLLVLGISSAIQLAKAATGGLSGITDIQITTCPEDNCSVPGYRKVPQDLNKYSRGSFVHLHFADDEYQPEEESHLLSLETAHERRKRKGRDGHKRRPRRHPITELAVQQGEDAEMGPEWEKLEGNLNDGNRGPVLTMFVKRDPSQAPIDSIVVKYGYDSHAAIGYDRLPLDLNTGTGGQWVYLYYKKSGPREPITHIATKACTIAPCILDDSWTRINRPIMTGTFKRYLYLFYKSVPGERPITSLSLGLQKQGDGDGDGNEDMDKEMVDTGIRFKNSNVFLSLKRGQLGDERLHAVDNIAVELGSNQIPYRWTVADFEGKGEGEEVPDWNAQVIYRTGHKALPLAPKLRFKEDGSFKIVQFADIHMATGPHSCYNAPSTMECTGDINTLEMMERMLDAEQPDLVVYTGDNVDGLSSKDAYATILKYSKPVVDRAIPWTIIFGNHDEEGDLSREEMMRSVQDIPYSLSERGPLGISGTGNYILGIHGHRHRGHNLDEEDSLRRDDKSQFTLYFLDSGAYSFNLEYPGWDWIKDDQVEWFRQSSREITSRYRPNEIPNALAFFHIPIPEYDLTEPEDTPPEDGDDDGDDDEEDSRKVTKQRKTGDDDGRVVGNKGERVSTPSYNSGMFDAIFESRDVRATTAGHDHINDYCLDHHGINLCYGGGLGYGSYGSASFPRRSRVFEILKNGQRADTWKRLDDPEMTVVSLQTLFEGRKADRNDDDDDDTLKTNPRSGLTLKPNRRPSRISPNDVWESLRQGGQYVLGGN